jgi:hypothetical protein
LKDEGVKLVDTERKLSDLIPPGKSVDEVLLFDHDSLRMLELGASVAAENLGSGSTLVWQENTITEAETEESSEDELSTVPQLTPPKFTVRTYGDHVRALAAHLEVSLVVVDARTDPIASEGLLTTGEVVGEFTVKARVKMDKRWNLRVVVSEVLNAVEVKREKTDRIEMYLHNPLVSKEGPIATSNDVNRIGKVGKLGDFVTATVCQLFVMAVPENSVLIRTFDDNVREISRKFVDVLQLPNRGKQVSIADLAGSVSVPYRLVEFYRSQITRLYGSGESVDFQAALANIHNPAFEYVRIEPGVADPPEGHIWLFVSHVDRNSGVHFGYPFAIDVEPGVIAKQVRQAIQNKLDIDDKLAGRWRLCVELGAGQRLIHLKEDDVVVAVARTHGSVTEKHVNLVLEHAHPNPELMGLNKPGGFHGSAAYKPLTIR